MSKRIVIIGGGFSGATCAQSLEKKVRGQDVEIVLINRRNYFVFTPLLVEAGIGSLEPRHAVVPLRDFLKDTRFLCGDVVDVDPDQQKITYCVIGKEEREEMTYDHLVIALGSVTRQPPVPGLAAHAFELKTMTDAVSLRDRMIQLLEQADSTDDPGERARLLTLVVVGANYTGVEVAGEFSVFMREACRQYKHVNPEDCKTYLVEIADRILPALDKDLAVYAQKQIKKRGLEVRLNTSIDGVTDHVITLGNGEQISTRTLVWCAGIAPCPVIRQFGLPCNKIGAVECERDLRVKGYDNIWAIGDCANNPDASGNPFPPTAQHATQMGKHLALNLARVLSDQEPLPCNARNRGVLASLGCRTAVVKILGVKFSGFPAWFLWRTVYLLKMPGVARRIRVAIDWTLALIFSRPIVQIGVHRPD